MNVMDEIDDIPFDLPWKGSPPEPGSPMAQHFAHPDAWEDDPPVTAPGLAIALTVALSGAAVICGMMAAILTVMP